MSQKLNQLIQNALGLQKSGQLQEAEVLYRKILVKEPKNPGVLHLLGLIKYQSRNYPEAIDLIRKAIQVNQQESQFHANLGKVLRDAGQTMAAEESLRTAILLNPKQADAHAILGALLMDAGDPEQAVKHYEISLSIAPKAYNTRLQLAFVLYHLSRFGEAINHIQIALQSNTDDHRPHALLGDIYAAHSQHAKAIAHYEDAIKLGRRVAPTFVGLGKAYEGLGQYGKAEEAYQQAMNILGDKPSDLGLSMGNLKIAQHLFDEGIAAYESVIEKFPERGHLAYGNLLLALHYKDQPEPDLIYKRSIKWAEQFARSLAKHTPPHDNTRDRNRQLRIGYVSADFRLHSVGYFMQGILPAHTNNVDVYLYSNTQGIDPLTRWFSELPHHWRPIFHKSDAEVANLIRQDKIDILIDLGGHTGDNRLLVFAQKPAPIQVTWLGYCNTTGLSTMDYLLSDGIAIPEKTIQKFSETIYRLPGSYLCYQAPDYAGEVSPPPFLNNKYITFGSFNNLSKVNETIIGWWCEILQKVPNARLVLKTRQLKEEDVQNKIIAQFNRGGISTDRIEILGDFVSNKEHFSLYGKIDIALDTYPYNGVTTTCDALWMGVPVITLAGDQFISRNSASILSSLELTEMIASNPEEYVDIAVRLAGQPEKLEHLRTSTRARFGKSALGNPGIFVENLESAFRAMWSKWCDGQNSAAENHG